MFALTAWLWGYFEIYAATDAAIASNFPIAVPKVGLWATKAKRLSRAGAGLIEAVLSNGE